MQEVHKADQSYLPDTTCLICLTDMEPSDNPVTLYCGHRYCLECIKAFGHAALHEHQTDKRCPKCRRLLCGDLLTPEYNELHRSHRLRFGIDRHEAIEQHCGPRGPHLLTDEQLRFECNAIIKKMEGTREELLMELLSAMENTSKMGVSNFIMDNEVIPIDMDENMQVELSATATTIIGKENATMIFAPMNGPVVVPIQVKGVPILASLSPNSFVTVVPRSIVDNFGLKTKPTTSSEFVTVLGDHVSISAVVDEFKFYLGDVEICLNNAVVAQKETNTVGSVQLGMDFFESAVWIRCSTRFSKVMMVCSLLLMVVTLETCT